jgi:hypothetical protein
MTKITNERRPLDEPAGAGLARFLATPKRKPNNNQLRFGMVTIERGAHAICKHDQDDDQKHTA